MFESKGNIPVVTNSSVNNGITAWVALNPTEKGGIITYSDTTTSEAIFYQPHDFVGYSHVQGLYPKSQGWTRNSLLFFTSAFRKIAAGKFSYGNKFNRKIAADLIVNLPTRNGQIDFEFIDNFIAELEAQRIAELEAYLTATGLHDYVLTEEEEEALNKFDTVNWKFYNLLDLFGKSTRGKRLKSDDRIPGTLPFITAGEANEGFSAFVGNNVEVFKANTTTIDMFGSAKYRNYEYGADDHVAVVHTENVEKMASIFITTAIHKASHTGKFNYGHNFYAKDADELQIMLPTKDNQPDYKKMALFASAIQKLVIKDVVAYADKRISATREIIS